ncbi:hypothetical protein [Streptomyces sp. NBC_01361]|uniref:hypothetical protein n=1 Tax=Streptomyces sp. NBC_01361 TaxID=2903838 RepID=UPI002E30DDC8|nr:hypothetical protein [Streptomyces sp. NBC_01361]
MPMLPPIGAEIPCSALAISVPLQIRDRLVSVDFRGGWKHRVEVNPNDPINSVRLRLIGFKMSAELPADKGAEGGSITIEQNDVDVELASLLKVTQPSPPKYECSLVMSPFTMAIYQPGREEQILVTKDKFTLIGQLTQYPPKGDQFQLQKPVDLVDLDKPNTVVATIQKFPVKAGGL